MNDQRTSGDFRAVPVPAPGATRSSVEGGMIAFAPSNLCRVCGGSGKDPPGSLVFSGGLWGEPIRIEGWQWTMYSTATLDSCWECEGTGKATPIGR